MVVIYILKPYHVGLSILDRLDFTVILPYPIRRLRMQYQAMYDTLCHPHYMTAEKYCQCAQIHGVYYYLPDR